MRVVDIGLILGVLVVTTGGCALQPADGHEETGAAAQSALSGATAGPATVSVSAVDNAQHPNLLDTPAPATQSTDPQTTTPSSWGDTPSCQKPPCDPDPNPWSPTPFWRLSK